MDGRHLPGGKNRPWARWGAAIAAASFFGLAPSAALAQSRTFYLDRLRIAGAPDDGIGVWRPSVGEKTRFYGQLGLGLSINPLRTDNYVDDLNKSDVIDEISGAPVTSQFITYVSAGIEILNRAAVGVTLPVVVYQSGNATNFPDYPEFRINEKVDLKSAAVMDVRFDGRLILFRTPDKLFKLAATGAVFVPTGNEFSYAGDNKTSGSFGVAAEYDFKKFFVVLNTGIALRPHATLHELNVGNELTYGVGGYIPLKNGKIRVGAEIFGSFGITDQTLGELDASPIEWLLNGKMYLNKANTFYAGGGLGSRLSGGYAPDFRTVLLVGGAFSVVDTDVAERDFKYVADKEKDSDKDGFPDVIDLCPKDPEDHKDPKPSDGCPHLEDRDNDGIPDTVDNCPDNPEDMDGIDDRDGCPEVDADTDGIPDAEDKCPKEPGQVVTVDPEKNGCPYYIRRVAGSAEIEIMKQVEFEFDKSTILPRSFPILDEIVRLLKANPEIKLISIEGHTDNQGTDEYNDRLAQNRAFAVRGYLTSRGVQPERLTSSGFGARRPIGSNETDEGRQRNRRVEFHIKSQTIEGR